MSDLYTDDDVERAIAAYLGEREETPFVADHVKAVLDAVLPAYRKRLLNELADEWYVLVAENQLMTIAEWLRAKAEEVAE